MDNNQNFGQQPMNANPFGQQPAPKKAPNAKLFELISIICSGVGFLMVFFGTIFTCTCSAKRPFEVKTAGEFGLSPIFILTIFGIVIAVAGIVLAIMAMKSKDTEAKAGKLSMASAIIGVAAAVFGILPLVTICGYNCSLNGQAEDSSEKSASDYMDDLDDYLKDLY